MRNFTLVQLRVRTLGHGTSEHIFGFMIGYLNDHYDESSKCGSRTVSHWGVLEDHHGDRHIIPCTKEGIRLEPHQADVECICRPRRDHDSKGILYIHNDPERGGTNA